MSLEKIWAHHLERKAILYVRQSSPYRVLRNRESGALRYAMPDWLSALGWSRIETADDDLSRSAEGGVVGTALIDQETAYVPRHWNDRLLLGP